MAITESLSGPTSQASWSMGPVKVEFHNISAASGATGGTVTAIGLQRVDYVVVAAGLKLSSQPTVSGQTVTLAFADPAATVVGQVILYGR